MHGRMQWEGGSQIRGCWDTENESLNNWEMLSNKGVGTADQWERGTATQQPITTLLIFWCGRLSPLSCLITSPSCWGIHFLYLSNPPSGNLLPIIPWANGANSGCNKNSGSSNHHSQLYSLFSLGMKIDDLVNKWTFNKVHYRLQFNEVEDV